METLRSLKSKTKHAHFKLSLLKTKKKRQLKQNANENVTTNSVKDKDNSKSNIEDRDLFASSDENYGNRGNGDIEPVLEIDKRESGDLKTGIDKDASKFESSKDVFKYELNNSEPNDSYIDNDGTIKAINSKSSFINILLDNYPRKVKLKDQIDDQDNMDVQKSTKRRRIELKNSKLNSSKRPKTDKQEELQQDEMIIDRNPRPKTDYNVNNLEPSKLINENGTKLIQSKIKKEKKTVANNTQSPKKKVKQELNNSESLIDLNFMYNVSETSIKEIDQNKEINLNNLPAESFLLKNNAQDFTPTYLEVDPNINDGPEFNNSKSSIDSEDHKSPSILKNSKLNSSKRPRTDKQDEFQQNEMIIDGNPRPKTDYNVINLEPSKLNDENGTKIIQSIKEKSKIKKEKTTNTSKTKSPKKKAKKELNNSKSLLEETSIKEIDRNEEINLNNLPAESFLLKNNGQDFTPTYLEVDPNKNDRPELNNSKSGIDSEDHKPLSILNSISESNNDIYIMDKPASLPILIDNDTPTYLVVNPNKNVGPELNNSKSCIDNEDHKPSTILNSISQSNNDINVMDKPEGLPKLIDQNDAENSEIKVEKETPKKFDSGINNDLETSLVELNNTKPKMDPKITNYFSRSKSNNNKNDINVKEIDQPPLFPIQKGKLRRKSISKSLFEALAITGEQDSSKIQTKGHTETADVNNIKTNTRKRLKSTTSNINLSKNMDQIELQNLEHIIEPETSKSIDDLVDAKSSFDNSRSNTNHPNVDDDDDILSQNIQKAKLRRKSISKSLFEAFAITGEQDSSKIQTEDHMETADVNNIKTHTRKRLKSTTSNINLPKNMDQKIEPETSKSIDNLVDAKSSFVNRRSQEYRTDEDDDDILSQKIETRQKSISYPGSSEIFDEYKTNNSQVQIEKANKITKPAKNLQKIDKTSSKTSESNPNLSIISNKVSNNSQLAIDTPVEDNNQETLKSVNENDLKETFEESQPIPEVPIKRGRGRPKSTAPKVTKIKSPKKINITTQLKKLKLKPAGKVTKHSIKETSYRKIPQNRLEGALQMIQNEDHPIWEDHNVSCNAGIHRYWEPRNALMSDQNMKLRYARQFLLRRDWLNLSKVLCLSTIDTKQKTNYYPLLSKYATLCLAHTDKEQFDKFVQFLIGMDDASSSVMKKCTNGPGER